MSCLMQGLCDGFCSGLACSLVEANHPDHNYLFLHARCACRCKYSPAGWFASTKKQASPEQKPQHRPCMRQSCRPVAGHLGTSRMASENRYHSYPLPNYPWTCKYPRPKYPWCPVITPDLYGLIGQNTLGAQSLSRTCTV